ncbi:DUF4340 domain-containing protein [Roseburia hominis]
MMKKSKTLWILLLIFALLVAIFLGLKSWNKSNDEEEEAKRQAQKVHIFEADSLAAMEYEKSDGTVMSFSKKDGEWVYGADETIGLAEDTMETLENTFSDITALKTIESPDALADYGLEEPQYRLRLSGEDEQTHTFLVGDAAGENYYFMEEGQETVYTVESALVSGLLWEISDVAKKDQFVSVTENNFVKEIVTMPDGTESVYDIADKDTKEESSENTEQESDADQETNKDVNADTESAEANAESADDEVKDEKSARVSSVCDGLASFYFTDCIDYHVTDGTLGQYGLAEGKRTKVVLTYKETVDSDEEKEITFYVGSKDDTGTYYYVQLEGSQMVNRVTATNVEQALGLSEFE